jgi:hypothetical protein
MSADGQEQERIREDVEVVNIRVPVRVFLNRKMVGELPRERFTLFVNGEEHPINAFFEVRKKIRLSEGGAKTMGKAAAEAFKPRLFVLIFNVSDTHKYLLKNIDYFFKKVIRKNDRLIILTNNFYLRDFVVEDVKRENKRLKKILQLEARRIRIEILGLRTRLRSLMESKDERSEEKILNERIYIRDYIHYLQGFKKIYFDLQSPQYLKIAQHLKQQKIEKYVFNFFQLGMFYIPKSLNDMVAGVDQRSVEANMESIELLELYQQAYKELQGFDKSLVDNIGKFFLNTEASFHTQFMRSRKILFLEGYEYRPISLDSENLFMTTAKMTGGSVLDSNKIEKFIDRVTAKEDIYYVLTYNPGKHRGKKQKIKVLVSGKTYDVIYDDFEREEYLQAVTEQEEVTDPPIRVKGLDLSDNILSFKIVNIKLAPTINTASGKVLVKIRIMDSESNLLFGREKELMFAVKEQEIKIRKLPPLPKGKYDIMVEALDLNTGKNDIAIEDIRVMK